MAEAALENPDLYDLTMSDEAQPLLDRVKKHVKENVDPWTEEYHALGKEQAKIDRWDHHPKQMELMDAAKQKARDNGLWNFFSSWFRKYGRLI
jgi:acyl-CoA dehydrogenase